MRRNIRETSFSVILVYFHIHHLKKSGEHLVPVIMKGLTIAHSRIQRFDLGWGNYDKFFPLHAICNMAGSEAQIPAILSFGDLRSLTLNVGCYMRQDENESILENTRIISRLISALPYLKRLEITLVSADNNVPIIFLSNRQSEDPTPTPPPPLRVRCPGTGVDRLSRQQ